VIKKGTLSLVHKSTSAGHQAFIIDAENKICTSDDGTTGLWIGDKFYQSEPQHNGAIFIPFKDNGGDESKKVVMVHRSFAEMG